MNRTSELGSAPVHKLLFKYAMPAIIAMTATSLYNIVDTIYIGHGCGALALGALTVAKPRSLATHALHAFCSDSMAFARFTVDSAYLV